MPDPYAPDRGNLWEYYTRMLGDLFRRSEATPPPSKDRPGRMDDLPTPPDQPASWYPDIPVLGGGKDLATEVYRYARQHPESQKRVSKVVAGPTSASIDTMIASKLRPDQFAGTNLLGIYSLRDHSIGINPELTRPDQRKERLQTVGHEMGHAAGISNEALADLAGENWWRDYEDRWGTPVREGIDQRGIDLLDWAKEQGWAPK